MNLEKINASIDGLLSTKAAKLNPTHKAAIAAAIVIIPCVIFFFLIFMPNRDTIAALEKQQATLQQEIKDLELKSQQITKHRAEKKEAELRFEAASLLLPQQKEIPSLLTNISSLGTSSGLDFISFRPQLEKPLEFYAEIPVSIQVSGIYHNVGNFLYEVSKLPRIVNVDNFTIGSPKMVEGEMTLAASFNLVTYRFLEQAEIAAAQKKDQPK